eukprot:XP_014783739.1 PREDICTED: centrosomal protein of 78 kDa-like [Octopus bimaculoides]
MICRLKTKNSRIYMKNIQWCSACNNLGLKLLLDFDGSSGCKCSITMEGVQARQRGAYDFETYYDNVCSLSNSYPLSAVKAHLPQGILDLNADRIRLNDWKPLLSTLSINKSLEFIVFTSSYIPPSTDEKKKKDKTGTKRHKPAIASKEIKDELCKALQQCLSVTPALACLRLQGIAFKESSINYISKVPVGRAIKNNMSLNAINLVGCNLSWKGADTLAKIIKHQSLVRHNEAWKNSLRYRQPDLECMTGLRRITLNDNPMIGDHGAMLLAEALRDDLWVKALDMQNCGISNFGGKAMNKMLQYNTTLVVLDVRDNPLIESALLRDIIDHVNLNCKAQTEDNSEPEYEWISLDRPNLESKPRKKKKSARVLNTSHCKKTNIKINGMCYHLDSVHSNLNPHQIASTVIPKPNRGMPWRTAMRATKQRGCFTNHEEQYDSDGNMEIIVDSAPKKEMAWTKFVSDTTDKENHPTKTNHLAAQNCQENTYFSSIENEYKKLQVELVHVKRELEEERIARLESDKNVYKLSMDNNDMQSEVLRLKKKLSLLEEENILDSIESAFMQFHVFLDILRDAGFGQLINMAGIDSNFFSLFKVISSRGNLTSSFEVNPNLENIPPEPESSTMLEREATAATSHIGNNKNAEEELEMSLDCDQCHNLRKNFKKDVKVQHNQKSDLNSTFELPPNESLDAKSIYPIQDPHQSQSNLKKKLQADDKENKIKEAMLKNMSQAFQNGSVISHTPDLYADSNVPAFEANKHSKNSKLPEYDFFSKTTLPRSSIIENIVQKVSLLKKDSNAKNSSNTKKDVHGGTVNSSAVNGARINGATVNGAKSYGATSPTDQTHVKSTMTECDEADGEIYQMRQNGSTKRISCIRKEKVKEKEKETYPQGKEDDQSIRYSVSESAICKNHNQSDNNFVKEKPKGNSMSLTSPQSTGSSKLKLLESLIEEESDSSEGDTYNDYSSFEALSSNNHCNPATNRSDKNNEAISQAEDNDSNDTSLLRSISDETF